MLNFLLFFLFLSIFFFFFFSIFLLTKQTNNFLALQSNSTLKNLSLDGNNFTTAGLGALIVGLGRNRGLKVLTPPTSDFSAILKDDSKGKAQKLIHTIEAMVLERAERGTRAIQTAPQTSNTTTTGSAPTTQKNLLNSVQQEELDRHLLQIRRYQAQIPAENKSKSEAMENSDEISVLSDDVENHRFLLFYFYSLSSFFLSLPTFPHVNIIN